MTDFLLELRSEEIPARMQARARDDLARLFAAELAAAGLAAAATVTYATPRRLALIARGLPDATAAVTEEVKGPRTTAPPQALDGFLRKTGLTRADLTERDGVFFAVTERPGRATAQVLAEAVPAVIRAFPWPKSMRWGEASLSPDALRWVRPLHGIVALFGEAVVPVEIATGSPADPDNRHRVVSGAVTLGHRFHHPGPITIGSAADYVEKLRACHVIVDQAEREALIRARAAALAAEAGLELVEDEGLVAENAGLTEWPVPLLGRFDEAFLDVPPEVIRLTARVNQKYFVCRGPAPLPAGEGAFSIPLPAGEGAFSAPLPAREGLGVGAEPQGSAATSPAEHDPAGRAPTPDPSLAGRGEPAHDAAVRAPTPDASPSRGGTALAPAFICTANIAAADGGAKIVEGNRKVLAARLADARFFYEQDLKVPLEEQATKLDRIVFHEKLGTVADKVERVAKLARWLVEEGIVGGETPLPFRGGVGGGGAPHTPSPAAGPHPNPSPEGEGQADLAALAERAARLCKADLVTGMVGEFPELQGVMGGYYALAQGEDPRVAAAIRDHYKPVGQGDEVPTAPVTVAVSLADKLDTLSAFFFVGEWPTGSKDPFALRRAALAVIAIFIRNETRVSLRAVLTRALAQIMLQLIPDPIDEVAVAFAHLHEYLQGGTSIDTIADEIFKRGAEIVDKRRGDVKGRQVILLRELHLFFADRLKVQQREAGVRHGLIDAVFAAKNKDGAGEDDLVRLLARVRALQAFMATEDGANLLTGYRRAANILKKEGYDAPLPAREGPGVGDARSASGAAAEIGADAPTPTPNPSLAGRVEEDAQPPLPPGEEGARSRSEGEGEGDANAAALHPHPSAPAALPPSPGGRGKISLSYTPAPAEEALIAALDSAAPRAAQAVAGEDFEGAMAALASLRRAVDRFFDEVTVNDPDPVKRLARLALLARIRDAVHAVADFSKIEAGPAPAAATQP